MAARVQPHGILIGRCHIQMTKEFFAGTDPWRVSNRLRPAGARRWPDPSALGLSLASSWASNSPAFTSCPGTTSICFNLAADLGFDDGVQFGAYRAHHVLRGRTAFAFDHLRLHMAAGRASPAVRSAWCPQPFKASAASNNVAAVKWFDDLIFTARMVFAPSHSNFRHHDPRQVSGG